MRRVVVLIAPHRIMAPDMAGGRALRGIGVDERALIPVELPYAPEQPEEQPC